MKKVIVISVCFLALVACKSKKVENRQVTFEWTETQDYCGGAYPPDDLIKDLRTPKLYNGSVYFHSDATRADEGNHFEIVDGKLETSGLSEGTYFVYITPKMEEQKQKPKTEQDQIRFDCEKKFNRTSLATFTIDKKSTAIDLNLHKVCNPCMEPRP